MESYEVLEKAIPKKASAKVAQFLSVSVDYVRRWRREPESEESPAATGQRSILDRICDLIDAVFLVNPQGVPLIINHVNAHYRNLLRTHAKPIHSYEHRAEHVAQLLTQTTEAINRLNIEGCSDETLRELIEMRDAADRTIKSVEKTMSLQEQ